MRKLAKIAAKFPNESKGDSLPLRQASGYDQAAVPASRLNWFKAVREDIAGVPSPSLLRSNSCPSVCARSKLGGTSDVDPLHHTFQQPVPPSVGSLCTRESGAYCK